MKLKMLSSVLALALIYGPALAESPAPPTISVLTAQKKQITEALNVTGTIAATDMVLVTPEVEGYAITDFKAEVGDAVKKDQVLVTLNDAALDIQIAQAKATKTKTGLDLTRSKELNAKGFDSQATTDAAQAAYDQADAQLNALLLSKARCQIKTPVAGYVATRNAQIGAVASASKPALYEIVRDGAIELQAEVPESSLPRVKAGQKASITVNGYDKPLDGEIRLVAASQNSQTRIAVVKIAVKSPDRIALGTFGRAVISVASAEAVSMPITAVTFGDKGPTVQLVKDGKVVVQKVITGLVGANDIQITEGVNAGDVFVARAGSFVRDGDAVTPVPLVQ